MKELWYHARLLEEAWPRMLKAQANEAHNLSDVLGDDHDLAVLATQFDHGGHAADVALDETALRELIARDRAELRAERGASAPPLRRAPEGLRARLMAYPRSARSHERSGQPARSAPRKLGRSSAAARMTERRLD